MSLILPIKPASYLIITTRISYVLPEVVSFYEFVLDGVESDFGIVFQPHFVDDVAPVGADRLDAQAKLISDVGDGLSGSDHKHYLVFPVGKLFVDGLGGVLTQVIGKFFRKGRADIFASLGDLANGGD